MVLNYSVHDGKTKANSSGVPFRCEKRLEYMRNIFREIPDPLSDISSRIVSLSGFLVRITISPASATASEALEPEAQHRPGFIVTRTAKNKIITGVKIRNEVYVGNLNVMHHDLMCP